MKRSILSLVLAGFVGAGLTARAEDPKPQPKTVSDTTVVHVKILDINAAKRQVTVKDESGDVETIAAPEDANLGRFKVGDAVTITYAETLTFGLAKPEEVDSIAAKRTSVGGTGSVTKVVTIAAIDLAAKTASFKGADGKTQTIKIRDPKNAAGYKVGDKVALTYTGSLQITVDKK